MKKELLEYRIGSMGMGTGYLQRLGSPGHYIYIYPPKKFMKSGKKFSFFYSRFIKRSQRFLRNLSIRYEATSMNVRPKTWSSAIIDIRKKSGDTLQMHFDFKKHQVYSYRSKRGLNGGGSAELARSKRQGVLRYR